MSLKNITYKAARADFEYLIKHHGNLPVDMTGGWGEGEYLAQLLKSPNQKTAADIYHSAIEYSASVGFENDSGSGNGRVDISDRRTLDIYTRYGLHEHLVRSWGLQK